MKAAYLSLAQKLGNPVSVYLTGILERLLTPEESILLDQLPLDTEKPAPAGELADRLNRKEDALRRKLYYLWRRGMIRARPEGYSFFSSIFGLFDFSSGIFWDPYVRELWREWYEKEWARDIARQIVVKPPQVPFNTVVPNYQSLDAFSKVSKEPVLPGEDPRKIVESVDLVAVRDCVCRTMMDNCHHPLGVCVQFNDYAESDIARFLARKVSQDEAISILKLAADKGLVHNYNGYPHIHSICNCCTCACIALNSVFRYSKSMDGAVARSRYEACINDDCSGCKLCLNHCNFNAITMVKVEGAKKPKAQVDPDKCMGCAACFTACKRGAISLKLVRPAPASLLKL